jgi:hypothetical protein
VLTDQPTNSKPPGLAAVLKSFYQIVDDIKRKPYDLLDYARNTFDRDYLEFNVNIHDLDSQMQVGGRPRSAFHLLRQFPSIGADGLVSVEGGWQSRPGSRLHSQS